MEQDFHRGDNQEVVAIGKVQATQPSDTCHGEVLGLGCLSVAIESCINIATYLPFPTNDACKVSEAIGGSVKWNMQDVRAPIEVNPCDKVDEKVFGDFQTLKIMRCLKLKMGLLYEKIGKNS